MEKAISNSIADAAGSGNIDVSPRDHDAIVGNHVTDDAWQMTTDDAYSRHSFSLTDAVVSRAPIDAGVTMVDPIEGQADHR